MSRRFFLFKFIPKNSVGIEVGVWKGAFTKELIKKATPSELHLVDPWIYTTGMKKYFDDGQESLDAMYNKIVRKFGRKNFISVHRCMSDQLAPNFSDGYFDWVYVDGNHSFEGVYSDLVNYHDKVKTGGFMIGDDYGGKSKGVKVAVDKFCKERNINFKVRKKQFWYRKE